jgi:membrane protease YdiL (CAAX protease family)
MRRSTALGRALLFLLVTSPIWAFRRTFAVFHPVGILAIVLGLTLLFLWWDRREPEVLGLDPKPRRLAELGGGLLGGALVIGVMAMAVAAALPFEWARNPDFRLGVAAWSFAYLLASNAVEELVFRGYGFERMIAAIGHWPAQILTALLFALFHVVHGWPWDVALVSTTLGSILFGLVFVRWRSVPAAVGVHVAMNWVRDLLLLDPPTAKTLYAPFALRRWMPLEQFTARVIANVVVFLACVAMAIVVHRHQGRLRASSDDAQARPT